MNSDYKYKYKYKYEKYKKKYLQLLSLTNQQFGGAKKYPTLDNKLNDATLDQNYDNDNFTGGGIAFVSEFNNEYYVLLANDRRWNKQTNKFELLWGLFGGGREGNETPRQCAFREFIEEFCNVKVSENILNKVIDRCRVKQKDILYGKYGQHKEKRTTAITYILNATLLRDIFDVLDENNVKCTIFKNGWKEFHDNSDGVHIVNMCKGRIVPGDRPRDGLNEIEICQSVKIKDLYDNIDKIPNMVNYFKVILKGGLFKSLGFPAK
jgi:hypothetical protein